MSIYKSTYRSRGWSYEISGAVMFALIFIFFAPALGALFGAFAGWVVSLFFDQSIRATFSAFGVKLDNIALWQLGATLGFVGGFFKSSLQSKG